MDERLRELQEERAQIVSEKGVVAPSLRESSKGGAKKS